MTTEIISVDDILNGKAVSVSDVKKSKGLFPEIRMHHTVQQELENPNYLHLYDVQPDPICINTPYSISLIASKNAYRCLCTNTQTGKNYYEKAYGNISSPEVEALIDMLKEDPSFDEKTIERASGQALLLALKTEDMTMLCTMEIYGIYNDYFAPFKRGTISTQQIVDISILNHKENQIKSKAGKFYHSPRNFKQYKLRKMTQEELETIQSLVRDNMGTINMWLERKTNKNDEQVNLDEIPF